MRGSGTPTVAPFGIRDREVLRARRRRARHVATAAGTGRADTPALARPTAGTQIAATFGKRFPAPTSTQRPARHRRPRYPTSTCCSCCITSSRPPTGLVLSELERHDLGFFVAFLCTPLLGDDLAAHLPAIGLIPCSPARPTATSAWPCHAGENERPKPSPAPSASPQPGAARQIVRTGFTLVMPRWHGGTSDLATSAQVFGHYYPGRTGRMTQMRAAAATARRRPPIPPCLACKPAIWYLVADQRGEPRLFRVARAEADEASAWHPDGVELAELWQTLRRQAEERQAVVARVWRDWLDMFRRICASHLADDACGSGRCPRPGCCSASAATSRWRRYPRCEPTWLQWQRRSSHGTPIESCLDK